MLTSDQVLTLIEAGFTAEEIRQYNAEPEQEQEQEPTQEPEQEQEPAQEPEQETFVGREEFNSLKESIAQLTKTIQANNILHASKETPSKTLTVEEAADAAIKAFFNS